MVFNRFFFKLLARVIFLTATIVTLSSIFLRTDLFFTQIILAGIIVSQIIELSFFANKTNVELTRFLAGVKDGDFQLNFPENADSKSFRSLNSTFRDVIHSMREYETEKAAEYQFLNEIISQISFGVIVFNEKSDVEVMNSTASLLLGLPKVAKWRNLRNPNISVLESLYNAELAPNQLLETRVNAKDQMFSVSATQMTLRSVPMKIVCFQDIRSEIQKKEIEAWQKLIRILTHETMNSVTPIVSLAETMKIILENETGTLKSLQEVTHENLEDLSFSLDTIIGRGNGILKFVSTYRKLTRIPNPEPELVEIRPFLEKIVNLISSDPQSSHVKFEIQGTNTDMHFDPVLMEQVLINLLKNAREALDQTKDAAILVSFSNETNRKTIRVQDNGPGIDQLKSEKIFIPFYTTKKDGSGIGLSVSRQIMSLHGGQLELQSEPGRTVFTLSFPN